MPSYTSISLIMYKIASQCVIKYSGTSIIQAPLLSGQPKLVMWLVRSLLTIMKFGLDESTRRKGCCLPVWWLVYSTNNNYHLVTR